MEMQNFYIECNFTGMAKTNVKRDVDDLFGVSPGTSEFNKMDISELRKNLYFFHQEFMTALRKGDHQKMKQSNALISEISAVMDKLSGVHQSKISHSLWL